ncbi:MAG: zinc-binding dehydrogenase [Myxococcales bacterium]|nr:zinc-binding dehydrogenase [Myxococcales bacterium]
MRALVTTAHGGLDVMQLQERPLPKPGPGQVRVRIRAAAFNHLDLWVRRGIPAGHWPVPIVPCADGAGTIDLVGPGVAALPHLTVGARVALYPVLSCGHCSQCRAASPQLCRQFGLLGEHVDGCAQEYRLMPADSVLPMPAGLSFTDAAAIPTTFITAWQMLKVRARVQPGESVVVHAAASGVGSAGVQIAAALGAHVIATVRRDRDVERAKALGADEVVRTDDPDWARHVRKLVPGGVHVVFEHIGAATWDGSVRALQRGGRLVTCGATAGHEVTINLRKIFFHSIELIGSTMGTRTDFEAVLTLAGRGLLKPVVGAVRPLAEATDAMGMLERREVFGKVVLTLD